MKLSISMTRRETLLGWSYLLLSMFVLPSLLAFGNTLLPTPLSEAQLNIVYFFLNFLCVVLIFRRFLLTSVKVLFRTPWRCLRYAALGFVLYYGAMLLVSNIILRIYPDFSNVNDAAIGQMSQENYALMAFCTVFLVPVTEETFYRGLFFQRLQRKSRFWAYLISTLVFAAIHVMGYIGFYDFKTLLLCFIQYLPAGIALNWAYEKADTIAAPILMHITINQIGMSAMR